MSEEYNALLTNNTSTSFNASVNNVKTSDETLAGPIYEEARVTNFAKLKRKTKIAKIALLSVTVGVTGGALTVSITNKVNGDIPTFTNTEITLNEGTIYYSFSIAKQTKYLSYFSIKNDEEELYYVQHGSVGDYFGEYQLKDYQGQFTAEIGYTNGADIFKAIKSETFTI